jgi:peptide-methionine (R)-S-oxide reductase
MYNGMMVISRLLKLNPDMSWDKENQDKKLSAAAYRVCRLGETEKPFSGKYCQHWQQGTYVCICCDTPLFDSSAKFDAGCGWPSFFKALANSISYRQDFSLQMIRTEIRCAHCQSHLGHVFDDGPPPTGKRYCVNSVSLDFKKA